MPLDNLDLLDVLGSGLLSIWVWTRFPESLPIELDSGFLSSRRPSAAKEPLSGEADSRNSFTTLGRSLPGETGSGDLPSDGSRFLPSFIWSRPSAMDVDAKEVGRGDSTFAFLSSMLVGSPSVGVGVQAHEGNEDDFEVENFGSAFMSSALVCSFSLVGDVSPRGRRDD